jgi:hypothetical protein
MLLVRETKAKKEKGHKGVTDGGMAIFKFFPMSFPDTAVTIHLAPDASVTG